MACPYTTCYFVTRQFTIVDNYLGKKYSGEKGNRRPDLLLLNTFSDSILLIEFKRPSKTINRDDENQAVKYRDELSEHFPNKLINILVIGGKLDAKYDKANTASNTVMTTYFELINEARQKNDWLLAELTKK